MAAKTNGYYDDLVESYLFAEVARRASKYEAEHPDVKMIRMGIGDVTRPLPPVVTGNVLCKLCTIKSANSVADGGSSSEKTK